MSDQPESSEKKPPNNAEFKSEIKKEIAQAIQGSGGDKGSEGKEGSDKEEKPDEKKPDDKKDEDKKEGDKKGGEGAPRKKFKWTPLKVIALFVVLVLIVVIAAYFIIYSMGHESTDDAYTTGYVHEISSRVTGNVSELLIVDNERVKAGQVLLKLDPRDYDVQVDKAKANYEKAKEDFDRVDALKDDVAISKQDYDQTRNNMDVAKANLDDANNQLSYCTIVAPSDGYIGNRTVNVGDRVVVGGALMVVVQDVWVEANFKETQLAKMKKNQEVEIDVDAIPGHKFYGRIDSFSPGTGSAFALLPPDNATGNFTKIVQRVPVKILFDPDSIKDFLGRLAPGLSVETSVTLDESVKPVGDQNRKEGQ